MDRNDSQLEFLTDLGQQAPCQVSLFEASALSHMPTKFNVEVENTQAIAQITRLGPDDSCSSLDETGAAAKEHGHHLYLAR